MAINTEKVKEIFDKFENDDFVGAKELLKSEIGLARDEHLKDKLGLVGKDEVSEAKKKKCKDCGKALNAEGECPECDSEEKEDGEDEEE